MRTLACTLAVVLGAAGCGDRTRDEFRPSTKGSDADDTARNVRDRGGATTTPLDQGNDEADLRRTAAIRELLMGARLSSDAKNVKVVTRNGRVTLRGPVKTQAEKDEVLSLARQIAGGDVADEIEVESAR